VSEINLTIDAIGEPLKQRLVAFLDRVPAILFTPEPEQILVITREGDSAEETEGGYLVEFEAEITRQDRLEHAAGPAAGHAEAVEVFRGGDLVEGGPQGTRLLRLAFSVQTPGFPVRLDVVFHALGHLPEGLGDLRVGVMLAVEVEGRLQRQFDGYHRIQSLEPELFHQ
jgi:hypothetical protein